MGEGGTCARVGTVPLGAAPAHSVCKAGSPQLEPSPSRVTSCCPFPGVVREATCPQAGDSSGLWGPSASLEAHP